MKDKTALFFPSHSETAICSISCFIRGEVAYMTNEQICIAIQSGTGNRNECLEQLYKQNAGMIEKIIRRYKNIEDPEDLRQESYFGIVRAAELWNADSGAAFITYAAYWILAAVQQYIDKCCGNVRIPRDRRGMIGKYDKTVNAFRVEFGRDPSSMELCAALDVSPDQLEEIRKDAQALKVRSTSEQIGGEDPDGPTLEDAIADERDAIGDVINRIQGEQLSACLWSEVDSLPEQQRAVIRDRYKEGHTLKECGAALGVASEEVRLIEAKAIRELRKPQHAKKIRPFLTDYGAYIWGFRNNGVEVFRRCGSSQERAMIQLEEVSGMSLWNGKDIS